MKAGFLKTVATLCLAISATLASSLSHAARDPIIMMSGVGSGIDKLVPMQRYLESNGWERSRLFPWTDSSRMQQDMRVVAKEIDNKVNEVLATTGASKVILVTWSASAIAGRYYIKYLGGTNKVSQYISFAGPHHGIDNWQLCQSIFSCTQWGPTDGEFLKDLNSGTEVPGSPVVKYLTLRSTNDNNVKPLNSAILAGANENYLMSGSSAPTHFTIIQDATALKKMRDFIICNTAGAECYNTTSTTSTTTTSTTTTSLASNCFTSSNAAHVSEGRAYSALGNAYARGSNQKMGAATTFVTSTLKKIAPYYYVIGTCN